MFLLLSLFACGEKQSDTAEVSNFNFVDELALHLTGTFDSSQQALENPTYYSVSLKTCMIEMTALGSKVLYVEQALSDSLNQPYRQRLYQLTEGETSDVSSHIYELSNPAKFIGFCDSEQTVDVSLDEISKKEGCSVNLDWNGEGFEGATEIGTCLSTMNGATYATSEVQTTSDMISSWDRGWDSNDQQVWGAVDGAYIFIRQ